MKGAIRHATQTFQRLNLFFLQLEKDLPTLATTPGLQINICAFTDITDRDDGGRAKNRVRVSAAHLSEGAARPARITAPRLRFPFVAGVGRLGSISLRRRGGRDGRCLDAGAGAPD
jgi:hypothetical protein